MGFFSNLFHKKATNVADTNNDGQVNMQDLGGVKDAVTDAVDINNDGQVNMQDAQSLKDKLPGQQG